MEREEGGRAEPEPARGRDKILCYINMQSPGTIGPEPARGDDTCSTSAYLTEAPDVPVSKLWKCYINVFVQLQMEEDRNAFL